MSFNFKFIGEIGKIHEVILGVNKDAVNDLLVDEILNTLGYNRKLDADIQKLYGDKFDWRINNGSTSILIKTYTTKQTLSEISEEFNVNVDIIIRTNGKELGIANNNVERIIDLTNISEKEMEMLGYLTKDGFDLLKLTEKINDPSINIEEIIRSKEVIELIVEKTGESNEHVLEAINELFKQTEIRAEQEQIGKDFKDELELKLNKSEEKIVQLQKEIEDIKNVGTAVGVGQGGQSDAEFRNQIAKLHRENTEKDDKILKLAKEIKELTDKKENKGKDNKKYATELIDTIEDEDDIPRAYVGVINKQLFQEESLKKYVGICLEKLYDIEGFNIMPILFDGDIFKITDKNITGADSDFMINTKRYWIDIQEETEESILSKLKTLFNRYESVVYEYKTIGKIENAIGVEVEELEYDPKGKTNLQVKYINLSDVMWNDNATDISIISVKVGQRRYIINRELPLNYQLIEIIDAILTNSDDLEESAKILMRHNYKGVSFAIKPNDGSVAPLPFSKLGVGTIESAGMMIPIISSIVNMTALDKNTIEFTLELQVNNQDDIIKYSINNPIMKLTDNEGAINLTGVGESVVISGNITDLALMNQYTDKIYYNLIRKAHAVKSKQMQDQLDTPDGRVRSFEAIISRYKGSVEELANALGNVMDNEESNKYKIMSLNPNEVTQDRIEINIEGQTIHISELTAAELTFTLIRLHIYINKNKSIGVQVEVDMGGLEFYNTKYETTNALKMLTTKTVCGYINNRI